MSVDIRVRGYHLDIYHHVNNARYLEFLEEGRWDYFDRHDFYRLFESENLAFVVVNINISYRRPAYNGELLRVTSRLDNLGNKSARMFQQVWVLENGEPAALVAEATVTFCLMDDASQQAVPIAGNIRSVLAKMIEEGL